MPLSAAPRHVLRCSDCGREPLDEFWQCGERLLCPECRSKRLAGSSGGERRRRLARSAVRAAAAATIGLLLYAGAAELAHGEISLLAPLIGWGVGRAVRSAADNGNDRLDRLLAAIATYLAVVGAAVPALLPDIASAAGQQPGVASTMEALLVWSTFVLAAPLLGGFENLLGLALLATALIVAWRTASTEPLELRGPFTLGSSASG